MSDFVTFRCPHGDCDYKTGGALHLGRVFSYGENHRTDASTICQVGQVVLEIQEAHRASEVPLGVYLDPAMSPDEVILSGTRFFYVPEAAVNNRVEVSLDYFFADNKVHVQQAAHKGLFVR